MPVQEGGSRQPRGSQGVSQAEIEREALLQHGEQIEKYEGKRPYQMGATNLGASGRKTPRGTSRVPKLTLVDATPRTPRQTSMPTTPNRTPRKSLLDAIPPTPGAAARRSTPRGSTPGSSSSRRSSSSGGGLDDWMLRMRGCPLVRTFDISKGVQQQNMRHLVDRVKWEGNTLGDDIQSTLLGMYGKTMNIQACRAVATLITFNNTLTALNLSDAEINDAGVAHLAGALIDNGNIVKVKLQGNRIGPKGGSSIASALLENSTIQVLDLHGNPIGAQGARAIGEALLVNSSVTDLNLRLCTILDDGCRKIAEALKTNRALTTVNLTGNEIGDGGGWALADALKKNRGLTSLTVCSNAIGGDAAPALADSLKGHVSLRTFNLIPLSYLSDGLLKKLDCSYRQCGSPGVQVVSELLRTSKSLTEVDLRNNSLNDIDVRSLMTAVWESDKLREDDEEEWEPLKSMDLIGNYEQKVIPRQVVDEGGEAVVELLRKMQRGTEEGEEVRLKWAFIGRGECGKTSFARSLQKGSELATECTVGLDITDGFKPFSKPPLVVSMWDFGGHGTYWRGSNQHFLTERRTLYLLCFDISYQRPDILIPNPADPKEPKAPWGEEEEMNWLRFFVRLLLTHVPRAVVTLVGLKADLVEDEDERARRLALAATVFGEVVAQHRIQLEEHLEALRHTPGKAADVGMTYQHMTDVQLSQQILHLEERIKYRMKLAGEPIAVNNTDKESPRQILSMAEGFIKDTRLFPDFRNIFGPKWRSLVSAVEALKAHKDHEEAPRYQKWEAFVDFAMSLEENPYMSEEEVEPAAELMHECGVIMYYKRDPVLRNLVVMDPEWLVESIFRLLVRHDYSYLSVTDSEMKRRMETLTRSGVLDALLLESLWEEHDRASFHDLFRLMVKFEVVMPYSRRTALFPLRLPSEPDLEVKRSWSSTIRPALEAVTGACIDVCPSPSGFFERLLCQIWPLVQLQKAWRKERSPGMPQDVDAGALATSRRTSATLLLQMQGEMLIVIARGPKPEGASAPGGNSKELLLELAADVRAVVDHARKLLAVGYHGAIFEMHALCPHCLIQPKGVAIAPEVAEGILMLSKDSSVVECPRCDLELPPRGRVYETLSGQADTPERLVNYEVFLSFRAARNRTVCVEVQEELKETLMTPYWDQGNNSVAEGGTPEHVEAAQANMTRALVEAYLFMPVLCRGTLVDMSHLTEESEDTLLMEYILASELQRSGSTQVVMPLLVGPNFPEEIARGIKETASNKVPSIIPEKVFDKVQKMLEGMGIHTDPSRRTVRKLVEEMLAAPCIVLSHQAGKPVPSHVRTAVEKIETTVKETRMSRLAGGVIVGDTSEQEYLTKRVGAVSIKLDVKVDLSLSQSVRRMSMGRRSSNVGLMGGGEEGERPLWTANATNETVIGFGVELRPSPAGAFEVLVREMQKSGCFDPMSHEYGPLKGGLPGEVQALAVFEVLRSHATLLVKMDGNAITVIARTFLRDRSDLEASVALRAAVNIIEDVMATCTATSRPVNTEDFVLCPKCLGHGSSGFAGENREDVLDMHKSYDETVDCVGAWDLYRFHQSLKTGTVIECLACRRKLMAAPALDVLDLDTPIHFSAGTIDVVIHYQNPPVLPKSEGPDRRPMYQDLIVEMGQAVGEDVRVFVDSRPDGSSMSAEHDEKNIEAILGCSVFMPAVNEAVLNAAVARDDYDILLPTILALELFEAGRIQAVVPVFIDGDPPKLKSLPPDSPVPEHVFKKVEKILAGAGLTSETVFPAREVPRRRTAREVAQGLLRCQGLKCPPMSASASHKSEPFERFFRLLATHCAGVALNGLRMSAEWQVAKYKEMMVAKYREAEVLKASRDKSPEKKHRPSHPPKSR